MLTHYKDGVEFVEKDFSKKEYQNVGVASDGLRFIIKSENDALKEEFAALLKARRTVAVKRFINRNQKLFRDDITIVF